MESFLNILATKDDEWSNLQVFHQRHFLLLFLFHLLNLIHPEGLFLLEGQQHPEKISHEDNLSRQANRNPAFRFKDEDDYEYEIRVEVFSRLLKI